MRVPPSHRSARTSETSIIGWSLALIALGLAWIGFVSASSVSASSGPLQNRPATRSRANPSDDHRATSPRPPLIIMRGISAAVPRSALLRSCRVLLADLPVRCEVRTSARPAGDLAAWTRDHKQLDAEMALEQLAQTTAPDGTVELYLTGLDMFGPGQPYVFGLANLTDRIAIVSLARLGDRDLKPAATRLRKLVLHEIGHTFGLHHHDDPRCVMRQDPTVATLDTAPSRWCARCHAALVASVYALDDPKQRALEKTRRALARGDVEGARAHIMPFLGSQDADMIHDFGRAFFETGHYGDAISLLQPLVEQIPRAASSRIQLGMAYQLRDEPGDYHRAVDQFERALALQPGWTWLTAYLRDLRRLENHAPYASNGPPSRDAERYSH